MISTKTAFHKTFKVFFFSVIIIDVSDFFSLPTKRINYILFQTEPSPSDTHIQWQLTCLCSQFPNYLRWKKKWGLCSIINCVYTISKGNHYKNSTSGLWVVRRQNFADCKLSCSTCDKSVVSLPSSDVIAQTSPDPVSGNSITSTLSHFKRAPITAITTLSLPRTT